jgi:MFS family permease
LLASVREPTRRIDEQADGPDVATTAQVVAHLKERQGEYLPIFGGMLFVQMMVYAVASWYASVLIRNYGLSISSAGFSFGTVGLIFGTAGAILGPFFAGQLERRGRHDAILIVGLFAVGIAAPATIWAPIAPNVSLSLAAMAVVMLCLSAASALAPLLPQLIAPNAMRARVTALYFFIANIIGLGVTPIIVGFINDAGLFGVSGINEAVSVTAAALLPTSFIILFVGRRALTRHQSQAMVRST